MKTQRRVQTLESVWRSWRPPDSTRLKAASMLIRVCGFRSDSVIITLQLLNTTTHCNIWSSMKAAPPRRTAGFSSKHTNLCRRQASLQLEKLSDGLGQIHEKGTAHQHLNSALTQSATRGVKVCLLRGDGVLHSPWGEKTVV